MSNKGTKGYYIKKANQKKLEEYGAKLDIPYCKPSASLYLDILLDEHFAALEKKEAKKKPKTELAEPEFNFKNELLAFGVDEQVLSDWLVVRKNKKASNTSTALKGLLSEITKSGLMVGDAIEYATKKSWSGFKAQWYFNENPVGVVKQYSDTTAKNIQNLEGDW